MNKVFIVGNLTRDVELRMTPSGIPVATVGVATNRIWIDKSGTKQKETEFHNVVLWGKQAELAKQYLTKGRLVIIEGRLRTRSWDDKKTGEKRFRTEIIAERIQYGPKGQSTASKELKPEISQEPEDVLEAIQLDEPPTPEVLQNQIDDIPF
jgi:single-strand DNA-binding protein